MNLFTNRPQDGGTDANAQVFMMQQKVALLVASIGAYRAIHIEPAQSLREV